MPQIQLFKSKKTSNYTATAFNINTRSKLNSISSPLYKNSLVGLASCASQTTRAKPQLNKRALKSRQQIYYSLTVDGKPTTRESARAFTLETTGNNTTVHELLKIVFKVLILRKSRREIPETPRTQTGAQDFIQVTNGFYKTRL